MLFFFVASPAAASEQDADVKMVVDTIKSDKAALKEFCSSDMSGMRSMVTQVVTDLARSGKLQTTDYQSIGGEAGRKLATSSCR